jgi:hypothetical protein
MRVVFLYRPQTESEGKVMDYVREYKMRHPGVAPETISLDSREGDDMAKLYGIYSSPAILAISHDGSLRQLWQEEHLPLMQDLDAYALAF